MELERISEASWDGSPSGYTDSQYQAACALDRTPCGSDWASKPPKERCSLPYKTASGEVSRAGVHAAAARINQVTDACPASLATAKGKLRSAYKALGEDVPDSLKADEKKSEDLDGLKREFGVLPGVARHGEVAMRWQVDDGAAFRDDGADTSDGSLGTLFGHFAVFNRWTEIDSFFEGRFLEQIAPGACKKTFDENRSGMRCLMQHGRDPVVGMKPLGPIRELEEDDTGARYEVPLFDTSYNRDLLPALKAGQYGASFRFQVVREEVNSEPGRSEHNPDGIEERTVTEMKVREFGPVTFPAYATATASVRSLNDWGLELDAELVPHAQPERLAEYLMKLRNGHEVSEPGSDTPPPESTKSAPPPRAPDASQRSKDRLWRTTRLSGAARTPLRTSKEEQPLWKL